MVYVAELALAVAVAAGLEGIGALALWRRSRTLGQWNQAFLSGLAILASLIFPLTLVAGSSALRILTIAVVISAVTAIPVLLWSITQRVREQWTRGVSVDFPSAALVAVTGALIWRFHAENLENSYAWDGFQIWATKAMLLFTHGSLTHHFLVPGKYDRLIDYPPLVPLFHALFSSVRGSFDWIALKPNYLIFFVSMLISVWSLGRNWLSPRLALLATAVVAAFPAFISYWVSGGYADMPQAALLVAAVAACTERGVAPRHQPLPFLLSGVLLVKSEGSVLLWIMTAAIAAYVITTQRRETLTWMRRYAFGLGWVLFAVGTQRAYLAWIPSVDDMYADPTLERFSAGGWIALECWKYLLDYREWGLLWPFFVGAAVWLLARGTTEQKLVTAGTLAALAAFTAIFYFTNWSDVRLHIEQAFPRLLIQIAPPAAVLVITAVSQLAAVPAVASSGGKTSTPARKKPRRNR